LLAGFVAALPQLAEAVNLYFMPGDAFFTTSLSEKSTSELPDAGGDVIFTHHCLDDDMALCGYAGFARLEVRKLPPEVATGLKTLYWELREQGYWKEDRVVTGKDGKVTREEMNPFLLLIYDKSFDPKRYDFGLKYNERWAELPEEALLDRKTLRFEAIKYEKFVSGEEALVRDWRDSRKVAGLPVEIPAGVKWASSSDGQHPPAVAKAGDLRFFVLVSGSFDRLYKREAYEEFWEVTPSGFRRFRFRPRPENWERTDLVMTESPLDQPQKLFEPGPDDAEVEGGEKAD
jgi:hypothetical protein